MEEALVLRHLMELESEWHECMINAVPRAITALSQQQMKGSVEKMKIYVAVVLWLHDLNTTLGWMCLMHGHVEEDLLEKQLNQRKLESQSACFSLT